MAHGLEARATSARGQGLCGRSLPSPGPAMRRRARGVACLRATHRQGGLGSEVCGLRIAHHAISYICTTEESLNIGRNMHITIPPTTIPKNAINRGSIIEVSPLTAASTWES